MSNIFQKIEAEVVGFFEHPKTEEQIALAAIQNGLNVVKTVEAAVSPIVSLYPPLAGAVTAANAATVAFQSALTALENAVNSQP
jgi:hypothetical protein